MMAGSMVSKSGYLMDVVMVVLMALRVVWPMVDMMDARLVEL